MDRIDRRLLLAIRLVIVPGLIAATYLSYTKLFDLEPICGTGGCAVIASSEWSEVFGIPVTVIGMVAYLTILASTFVKTDLGRLVGAFVATCGVAFSGFLQYQALVVLERTCPWCITSAVCMLILAVLTVTRVVRLPKSSVYEELPE